MGCDVIMVGVAVCGSVSSIKALWETRIKKVQEEEEEQKRRTVRGGSTGRSDSVRFSDNLATVYNKNAQTHIYYVYNK